jgi:uncharacterized membrane protein
MAPELTAGLLALHLLAAVAWVGGIFFATMALRPASMLLEAPQRLSLWAAAFGRFFPWVWGFIAVLLASGHGLLVQSSMGGGLVAMAAIGWGMSLLFAYLYFVLFAALRRAVAVSDTPAAARAMAHIRPVMVANLALGLAASALGALHPLLG